MPWSAGLYTRWNAANVPPYWVGDASVGIKIEATRHDTQDQDFQDGINACLNKDGSNSMSGNLNFGGNLPSNIGAGTAGAPAICTGNDINTGVFGPAADTWAVSTNGSERLRVDSTGKVGIGTTVPANGFNVVQYDSFSGNLISGLFQASKTTTSDAGVALGSTNGNAPFIAATRLNNGTGTATSLYFKTDGTDRMLITNSGEVVIGANTSNGAPYKLQVGDGTGLKLVSIGGGSSASGDGCAITFFNGASPIGFIGNNSAVQNAAYNDGFTLKNLGAIFYVLGITAGAGTHFMKWNNTNGAWTYDTSSERYKNNITDSSYGLDAVLAMRPVTFTYKAEPTRYDVGFIAEEMVNVVPEVVAKDIDGNPDAISYDRLTSVLCKAIQELAARVAALEEA
ncbi:MAG: tail fiber domain-containing protein [Caulobacteraceae bacterium]|nr:tail fiber domain-containing protein [Caulobacteraceae bacterium]